MTIDAKEESMASQRTAMYRFAGHNPYYPAGKDIPLVQENLERLQAGDLNMRSFLRQTPQFPRWGDQHLRAAQVLLITNEPGLNGVERLYADMDSARSVKEVADRYQGAMLSWLGLSDHPQLKAIHGETPWQEDGPWQTLHPSLASCGKAGYFMAQGEEARFAGAKVLHLELSPFAQKSSQDVNPRNDRDLEYHNENLKTVRRFCSLSTKDEPRYIFIVGNRACIRQIDNDNSHLNAAGKTANKDKSAKILDLLRVADLRSGHVQVRLCQRWPVNGRKVNVLTVEPFAGYGLRSISKG